MTAEQHAEIHASFAQMRSKAAYAQIEKTLKDFAKCRGVSLKEVSLW